LEKNGSFGFLKLWLVCWQKPNVPFSGWFFTLSDNVLALDAVADFGAQNCQYTTNVDAR